MPGPTPQPQTAEAVQPKKPQTRAEWLAEAHAADGRANVIEQQRTTEDHDDVTLGRLIREEQSLRQWATHCHQRAEVAGRREAEAALKAAKRTHRKLAKDLHDSAISRIEGTAARVDKAAAELIAALVALRDEGKPLGEQFVRCMAVLHPGNLHDSLTIPLPHVRGTGPEFGAALAKVCYLANRALSAESAHLMGFSGLVVSPASVTAPGFVPYTFAHAARHAVESLKSRIEPLLTDEDAQS